MSRRPEIDPAALAQIVRRYPQLGSFAGILRNGMSVNTAAATFETSEGRFFAKRYDLRVTEPHTILGEHGVILQLRAENFPTPMIHANNRGDTVTWLAEQPYAVFALAHGEDRYGDEHVFAAFHHREDARSAGAMLARFHLALRGGMLPAPKPFKGLTAQYRAMLAPDIPAALEELLVGAPVLGAYVRERAEWEDVKALLAPFAERLEPYLGGWPLGIIHGDWIKRNLFWKGHEVADVLDFDLWNVGHWVYDLALALLPIGFDWPVVLAGRAEPNHADMVAFLAGYQEVRPLEPDERAALPIVMSSARVEFYLSAVHAALLKDDEGQAAMFWDLFVRSRMWFAEHPAWAEALES
jgi:Ser/Thr protein kinase RdoA (MazF antagonist)